MAPKQHVEADLQNRQLEAGLQAGQTRRTFIKTAGVGAAATLMSGLPAGWVGAVYADDSPEVKAMRFGNFFVSMSLAV